MMRSNIVAFLFPLVVVISVTGCTTRNPEFGGILGASSYCSNHNIGHYTYNDVCNSFCQFGPAACR
ncbi:hypothetical protein ZOSMA_210G00040 [Zostera marina]|uniref:Lipoprotein n=1 Tax=Zostera marina TaxID=29655 RepID=A0A0K9PKC8_ZOSMR|nr:hypothetical protein ZOSMA_210G00040 [Zostera marina]